MIGPRAPRRCPRASAHRHDRQPAAGWPGRRRRRRPPRWPWWRSSSPWPWPWPVSSSTDRRLEDVLPLLAGGLCCCSCSGPRWASPASWRRAFGPRAWCGTLRADLTGQLLRLGPTWTSRERSGEISGVLIGGLESIEDYVTQFLPARWLAMIVPLLVLLMVLRAGPALGPRAAVHGAAAAPAAGGHRRPHAGGHRSGASWRCARSSAFFLDILRGIATLKMFGRSREQVDNLRAHQPPLRRRHHGRAAHGLPDLAGARVGRHHRHRAGRGRDRPAPARRRHRLRARPGGAAHHARVLPAAAGTGHPLPRRHGGQGRHRADLRDPRRAGASEGTPSCRAGPSPRPTVTSGRPMGRATSRPWPSHHASASTTSASPTRAGRPRRSTVCAGAAGRAVAGAGRAPAAPASRRSRACCCASSSRTPETSRSMGGRCRAIPLSLARLAGLGAAASAPLRRHRRATTSAWPAPTPTDAAVTGAAGGGQRQPSSSSVCRAASTRRSARPAPASPEASGSASPSPARSCATRRCWCSTRPPRTRTRPARPPSPTPSSGSWSVGPCSSSPIGCSWRGAPTGSSSSTPVGSSRAGRRPSCSRRDGAYRRLLADHGDMLAGEAGS